MKVPLCRKHLSRRLENLSDCMLTNKKIRTTTVTDWALLSHRRHELAEAAFKNYHQYRNDVAEFPSTVRVIPSVKCSNNCGARCEGASYCHFEGLWHIRDVRATWMHQLTTVRRALQVYGCNSAKLIGLESIPVQDFCRMVSDLRSLGLQDVSATCADLSSVGMLFEQLAEAGLTRITLTMPSSSQESRAAVERDIKLAHEVGLPSPKINHVLLRSRARDLIGFLDWAGENALTVRLFNLISTSMTSQKVAREHMHWVEMLPLIEGQIAYVKAIDYTLSCRRKYMVTLQSGLLLELSLRVHLPEFAPDPVCSQCRLHRFCEEGLWGCGIRIGPDARAYPCLLRPELSFSFDKERDNGPSCYI